MGLHRMCNNVKPLSSTGPEAPTSCKELVCSFGASCIEVNGQAHCECPSPDCDEKNKTKVGLSSCLRLEISSLMCKFATRYKQKDIVSVAYRELTCVPLSPLSISVAVEQVCGSDGVTYADQCQLRTIACRQDKDITVQHFGQCTGEPCRSLHASRVAWMANCRQAPITR